MEIVDGSDPVATRVSEAVRSGDLHALEAALAPYSAGGRLRIRDDCGSVKTLLHLATDWPGYFPNGPDVVRLLIAQGAEPSVPLEGGRFAETPLHWAASSDDADVAAALIDGGADLEAVGASIGGGPPLDNAVGYGCWHVARLLVARGARVDRVWHVAALGMLERLEQLLAQQPLNAEELGEAFWQACHGGQRRAAARLLELGADVNFVPGYAGDSTPLGVARSYDTRREGLISWLEEQGALPTGG